MTIRRPYTYQELKGLNKALEDELNFQTKDKLIKMVFSFFLGTMTAWLFLTFALTN